MAHPFYTIGHSTRSIEEFVELLRPQQIKLRNRCPDHSAIADQPPIQCEGVRPASVRVSNRL